ncbi:MAG: zinc-dependent alcohol dehydrogenase, partial [Gammaproteobacteria bacterium]
MTQSTEAFWVIAAGHGEIRQEALPAAGPGDVCVRAHFSAVSRGTESLVWHGAIPASEHARMRAPFQSGEFPFPVKYGYSSVGVVESGEPSLIGQTVFCLHPHQSRYVVPASAVTPVPAALPAARAVLAANMETALNALWDAAPGPGDRISVIGAGVVGALVAFLCARIPGTDVELVDIAPDRAALATALGCRFEHPDTARGERDLVIHSSGNPAGLRRALALAGVEAIVLEMSWYGAQDVSLPLGEAFHSRRLTLKSSQVGRLPPARAPRWDFRRRLALALELLCDARLDALVNEESSFNELPQTMNRLCTAPSGVLCHR